MFSLPIKAKRALRFAGFVIALGLILGSCGGMVLAFQGQVKGNPSSARMLEGFLLDVYLWAKRDEIQAPASADASEVSFTVRSGDTAAGIAWRLQSQGLIKDANLFRKVVKSRGLGERLEAGEYRLRRNMTMDEIIAALQHGQPGVLKVTIREGLRAEEVAELLGKQGLVDQKEFLRAVATGRYDYPFLRDRPAGSSLEGYLFPDTYHIAGRPSAEALVGMMLEGFGQRFTPAMRQQAAERKLTIHQAVTVASLVEREAQAASERPIIAAIYLKRWAAGMPLEADATVQYAIGYRPETKLWWNPLQLSELRTVQSPYNTYLNPGLPPGPICSPGLASLQAVLQPAKTDFLYYYSKGDGTHAFARSFEEHLENQKKYQK
jgi:UPF0755 protein